MPPPLPCLFNHSLHKHWLSKALNSNYSAVCAHSKQCNQFSVRDKLICYRATLSSRLTQQQALWWDWRTHYVLDALCKKKNAFLFHYCMLNYHLILIVIRVVLGRLAVCECVSVWVCEETKQNKGVGFQGKYSPQSAEARSLSCVLELHWPHAV